MIGWIADALQLTWGYIYWNARKTRFRLARGRVPCPCQAPSDSGRAMETACEASLTLNRPPRFRHVCPLLKQRADGRWVCSVDSEAVRPFWGRAFGIFCGGAAVLYLVFTFAAFGLLRARQYPIQYYEVAWPPAWKHFRGIQSQYFTLKANRALARRDVGEAVMALSIAYQLEPSNFARGFTLAQLTAAGEPALSDAVYAQLLHDHPGRSLEIFPGWYQSLLWRGDYPAIKNLAREALANDPGHSSAWLYALIFAEHRMPDRARLEKWREDPALTAYRAVFDLELQTGNGGPLAREALLRRPPPGAPDFLNFYRPSRLIEIGYPDDALALLSANRSLPDHDVLQLRLAAYARKGWATLARNEMLASLTSGKNPVLGQVIAAQLVRQPDPETLAAAFDAMRAASGSAGPGDFANWTGWLCAAGANQDFGRFNEAREELQRIAKGELRALRPIESFFHGEGASRRIESYLPDLQPLSLDVTYALLERYPAPATRAR